MPDRVLQPVALRLFAALRQRQYQRASAIIKAAMDKHCPEYIHLDLILPVTGLLASHVARGITAPDAGNAAFDFLRAQLVLVRKLFDRRQPLGRTLLATTLPGEMQVVGLDIICDWLWRDGWDILRPADNADEAAITAQVLDNQPDVLAFSCTLPRQIAIARRIIRSVRQHGYENKICIGGMAINAYPELLGKSLADQTAPDITAFVLQLARDFHYATAMPSELIAQRPEPSTDVVEN
jgi:methanogenic corrinoid protein MtbC1